MTTNCPACGATLNVSVTTVPAPPEQQPPDVSLDVPDLVDLVACGRETLREIATAAHGRPVTRAELERVRRLLATAVGTQLAVSASLERNVPVTRYRVMATRPATG